MRRALFKAASSSARQRRPFRAAAGARTRGGERLRALAPLAPLRALSSPPSAETLRLSALYDGMEEGTVTAWRVREGDAVRAGDVLAEIDTEDAVVAFISPSGGVVSSILLAEGETAQVGKPFIVLAAAEEGGEEEEEEAAAAAEEAAPPHKASAPKPASAGTPSRGMSSLSRTSAARRGAGRRPLSSAAAAAAAARVRVAPAAARLVRLHGVDAASIRGTGKHGHVTKGDVLAAVASGTAAAAPAASAASAAAAPAASATPAAAAPAADAPRATLGRTFSRSHTDTAPSAVRKVIARRLAESKSTVPHAYASVVCGLDPLLALRDRLKARPGAGKPPSVNDFVIRAVALALRDVPEANCVWDARLDEAVQSPTVDVSVAVATPGGLITPIVRRADTRRLDDISATVRELASRARENRLAPEEFQGGSFTVSNLGMFGVGHFSAVINPPQACILAVGSGVQRVVLRNGGSGGGGGGGGGEGAQEVEAAASEGPATVTEVTVTLSSDERAVDGTVSARLLEAFRGYVEQPLRMLR